MKEYALYKGDKLLDIGSLKYLSHKFNIKIRSLLYYQTPTYQKRTSKKGKRLVKVSD